MTEPTKYAEFLIGDRIVTGVTIVDAGTGLPITPSGGGGLSDVIFSDSTGQVFAYRDTGTGTPTAYKIPEWTVYTPVSPVTAVGAQTNYALETGGNLASLNDYTKDTYGTGFVTPSTPASFECEGKGTVVFVTSGTWVGSIVIEYSPNNVDWYPTTYVAVQSGGVGTQFSANTTGQVNTVGFDYIRLRSSTITSGTATVNWYGSRLVSNVMLDNPLPAGSNTIGKVQVINAGGTIIDTSAKQDTTNALLGRFANLRLYAVDDQGLGTTYVMKVGVTSADPWLIMKLVEDSGVILATYAGVVNNSGVTVHATAWANRATLAYSDLTGA